MTNRVLSFHYVLTNNAGQTIDSSRGQEPFAVMEGSRQIIPDLEKELFQMKSGEKRTVHLKAAQAYGEKNDKLKMKVPRTKLPEGDIQVGSQFHGGDKASHVIFTVIGIEGDVIELDGNHPLAGQDLTFEVEVTGLREATPEEMTHGHAHGAGGHHH